MNRLIVLAAAITTLTLLPSFAPRDAIALQHILPSWSAEGDSIGAHLGWVVAGVGDVNGDGFDDVMMSLPRCLLPGWAYGYYGGYGGPSLAPDWELITQTFGYPQVAGAGDVNGDGFDDVIISHRKSRGLVTVFHGSPDGLPPLPQWFANDPGPISYFGGRIASAGDVNGDGYSDILVISFGYESTPSRVYLYYGSASGLPRGPSWSVEANEALGSIARRGATAGDVNGDGYLDVIIGACGAVFLYLGGVEGLEAAWSWRYTADYSEVACAGDVNGDGHSDVIVGSPGYENGEGRALVFHGCGTGLSPVPSWIAEPRPDSTEPLAKFGNSVASAGDFDGDGYSDVIVGANSLDNPDKNEGAVFLYRGGALGLLPSPTWMAELNQERAEFGFSVDGAGDTNGDGYTDVIAGAPYYDSGEIGEGCAVIYNGGQGTPTGIETHTPKSIVLHQNHPNPFSESTSFEYQLTRAERATITIYDVRGSRVATIAAPPQSRGVVTWAGFDDHGRRVASGVYVYRVEAGGLSQTRKMVILR